MHAPPARARLTNRAAYVVLQLYRGARLFKAWRTGQPAYLQHESGPQETVPGATVGLLVELGLVRKPRYYSRLAPRPRERHEDRRRPRLERTSNFDRPYVKLPKLYRVARELEESA